MPLFGSKRKQDVPPSVPGSWDLPDIPPQELAAAVRHLTLGAPLPNRGGSLIAVDVVRHLNAIASNPQEWPTLKLGERIALLTTVLLTHGISRSAGPFEAISGLYRYVAAMLSQAEKLHVIRAVAQGIVSNDQEVAALLLIIVVDDDPVVVSTAALEYSLLFPLKRGDPMTGVKRIVNVVSNFPDGGSRSGATLGGAVMNGDRRAPQCLDRTWSLLDQRGKQTVTAFIQPGLLLTGTIEFYLRWLEDPNEQELGMPAATLASIPRSTWHDGTIREVERRLPANYHATPEQDRKHPPVRVIKQWSVRNYGRTIMPRLEKVWKREGRPDAMRIVMQAWS